ncbi:hypothetical protein AGLY_001466 [Aphis glycines]|uniref:Uncharacterized protein n=1 Tax=Aphis glycines TaxID=307491 RepID=A0A6G0U5Q9_APHGL|nr:hypothetical protein AGLY_001466 [Aphis glycines]
MTKSLVIKYLHAKDIENSGRLRRLTTFKIYKICCISNEDLIQDIFHKSLKHKPLLSPSIGKCILVSSGFCIDSSLISKDSENLRPYCVMCEQYKQPRAISQRCKWATPASICYVRALALRPLIGAYELHATSLRGLWKSHAQHNFIVTSWCAKVTRQQTLKNYSGFTFEFEECVVK